jgi:epoxyqueuosine reductase
MESRLRNRAVNNVAMKKLSIENQPEIEGLYQAKSHISDKETGFEITSDFQRFNACNTVFSRIQWDTRIKTEKGIDYIKSLIGYPAKVRQVEGYHQKDFALRNASWVMANLMMERSLPYRRHDGFTDSIREYKPPNAERVKFNSEKQCSDEIKKVARLFGAGLVGITSVDERWHYTHRFNAMTNSEKAREDLSDLTSCIVVGISMPHDIVAAYPSALAGVAPGLGYSKESFLLQTLAQYIRNIGYNAVASLSDTAQAIPYAIQAGLGEYAKNGLVITKEYGPRVRFGMIFTDLPVLSDRPIKFGVKQFCEICNKCAEACPAKAIPFGGPSELGPNQSNIVGVRKWNVDGEKCFKVWASQGTECGICIRVCPYNKSNSRWTHRLYFTFFRWLASTSLRRIALVIDQFITPNNKKRAAVWWSA